ncbi:MAG: glucose-6-phosphate isomerase, partial [Actinomycetota bacterium]
MCDGKIVNTTENQPALHTALRADAKTSIRIGGENAVSQVHDELAKVNKFVDATRREKRFKNLVNIGIGGSDLGPRLINDVLS